MSAPAIRPDVEQPQPDCLCSECGDGVYFVEGVRGPGRWRHCRTGEVKCAPLCAECGQAASVQVGSDTVDGGQRPTFRRMCWLCTVCAGNRLLIERT